MSDRRAARVLVVAFVCGLLILSAAAAARTGSPGVASAHAAIAGASTVTSAALPTPPAPAAVGSVAQTLVLMNNTLVPGNFRAGNVFAPLGLTLDPDRHYAYVVGQCFGQSAMAVVDTSTGAFVATVPIGPVAPGLPFAYLRGIVYVHGNDQIYVADMDNNKVIVVNASTRAVAKDIFVGAYSSPIGLAYDLSNGHLYVADVATSHVTVIDTATDTVLGNVTVGFGPSAIAFDGAKGTLYVANYNSNNVTVIDGATDRVVANIGLGVQPSDIAYSNQGKLYVTQPNAHNVSVIDDSTNTVAHSIALGSTAHPGFIAYDGPTGDLYVSNGSAGVSGPGILGNVLVIDGGTDTLVDKVTVGSTPAGIVGDPSTPDGNVFVANVYSANLTEIRGTTNTVVDNITVGVTPAFFAYDPANDRAFVTNVYGHRLLAIDGTTHQVAFETDVGATAVPLGIAFDTANGHVYVGDFGTGSVVVVDGTTGLVVTRIPLTLGAYPIGIAFDALNGYLYVADNAHAAVVVIDGSSNTVVGRVTVGTGPGGIAFDATNGHVYVANQQSGNVTVIDGATNRVVANVTIGAGTYPFGIAFDPANGYLYVALDNAGKVAVLNGATNRVVGNITLGASTTPLSIAYAAADDYLYVTDSYNHNVTLIDPSTGTVLGSMEAGWYPYGVIATPSLVYVSNVGSGSLSLIPPATVPRFTVTFTETGLPAGTSWSVTLGGTTNTSTGSMIGFYVTNGTYSFSVAAVTGYTATPASGQVTVNGAAVGRTIAFAPVAPPTHTVTFTETGLAAGTSWSVTLGGTTHTSTTTTITFSEPDGTYAFTVAAVAGYSANPSSGSVTVTGADVSRLIAFSAATFTVTFTETGLPSGTSWSVTLGGATKSSTTTSIAFTELNGTYSFTVAGVTGYTASPSSGSVTVDGQAAAQVITFAPVAGGPTISSFTVTSSPMTLGSSVTFSVAATGGTGALSYAYSGLPPGCASTNASTLTCTPTQPGSYTVTVTVTDTAGHADHAAVSLVVNPAATILGLDPAVAYVLFAAIAAVVVLALAWVFLRSRKKRQAPPGETPPPPPPSP